MSQDSNDFSVHETRDAPQKQLSGTDNEGLANAVAEMLRDYRRQTANNTGAVNDSGQQTTERTPVSGGTLLVIAPVDYGSNPGDSSTKAAIPKFQVDQPSFWDFLNPPLQDTTAPPQRAPADREFKLDLHPEDP